MWRITAMSVATFFLIGCAGSAQYEAEMDTWLGQHVDDLAAAWGEPDSTRVEDDATLYRYEEERTAIPSPNREGIVRTEGRGGMVYGGPEMDRLRALETRECRTTFRIDHNGVVQEWRTEGDGCRDSNV